MQKKERTKERENAKKKREKCKRKREQTRGKFHKKVKSKVYQKKDNSNSQQRENRTGSILLFQSLAIINFSLSMRVWRNSDYYVDLWLYEIWDSLNVKSEFLLHTQNIHTLYILRKKYYIKVGWLTNSDIYVTYSEVQLF